MNERPSGSPPLPPEDPSNFRRTPAPETEEHPTTGSRLSSQRLLLITLALTAVLAVALVVLIL